MSEYWWNDERRQRPDGDIPARDLLPAELITDATFITARFLNGRLLNRAGQWWRLSRDAVADLAVVEVAFAKFIARLPDEFSAVDAMGRLVLCRDGSVAMDYAAPRRKMWSEGERPLEFDSAEISEPIERKLVDRSWLPPSTGHSDGTVLFKRGVPIDGGWFSIGFLKDGELFFPNGAIHGATSHFVRGVLPLCAPIPWREANGAIALSSLLGAAPVGRIGGVSFESGETSVLASQINDLLCTSKGC